MLKNGFYNLIGAIIRIGLTVLSIPAIIHFIGIQEYGLWSLVSSVMGIVALAEAGLSVSTTVFLSRDIASENTDNISATLTVSIGAMLLLATTVALLLGVGADRLVNFFPNLKQSQQLIFVKALQLSGLVIWAQLLQRIFISLEQAYEKYGLMNVLLTLQLAFNSLGAIGIAWLGGRTVELLQWQVVTAIGALIAHGWLGWLLVVKLKLRPIWNRQKSWAIVRYSMMTWVTSLGSSLFTQGDRLIVGSLFNTEILGVYTVITSITSQINTFSALPVQPLLPKLSQELHKGQTQLEQLMKQALQINSLIAIGFGGTLLTLAPIVISLMIPGAVTHDYILPFRVAIIIYTIYSLNAVGHYVLFAVDALNISMIIQLLGGILSLGLILIGGNFLKLLGAILGNAGYFLTGIMTFLSMKKLHIPLKVWLVWIRFPIIWFLLVILFNLFIPDVLLLKGFLLVLQSLILLKWSINFIDKSFSSL